MFESRKGKPFYWFSFYCVFTFGNIRRFVGKARLSCQTSKSWCCFKYFFWQIVRHKINHFAQSSFRNNVRRFLRSETIRGPVTKFHGFAFLLSSLFVSELSRLMDFNRLSLGSMVDEADFTTFGHYFTFLYVHTYFKIFPNKIKKLRNTLNF